VSFDSVIGFYLCRVHRRNQVVEAPEAAAKHNRMTFAYPGTTIRCAARSCPLLSESFPTAHTADCSQARKPRMSEGRSAIPPRASICAYQTDSLISRETASTSQLGRGPMVPAAAICDSRHDYPGNLFSRMWAS
jgi:hypothetical protein